MAVVELNKKLKEAVSRWRAKDYQGATEVTKRLLNFWFNEDHTLEDEEEFKFWKCQREAIDAVIYLYEICGYTSLHEIFQNFNISKSVDPTQDKWPKYCFKMATGSGKTFVMAMA